MSYFYNNKLYDYYKLTDTSVGSDEIVKDVIEIVNNEEIRFDFSELKVLAPNTILNSSDVETVKISIDWGDDKNEMLSLPLVSNKSSIGIRQSNQWRITSHLFNVNKRYEYNTEDINLLHQITVTVYNSFNDKLVIHIPYKMVYKTLYDLGTEISLFSSNTTNKNTVSYTLKQKSTDSMIVVNTRDWRSIYGEDDVEVIEQSASELFVDEFVNEDVMVWDWNSVPEIVLSVTTDVANNFIKGSFIDKVVAVEEWQPSVILKKDSGDEKILTEKQSGFNFITAQSYVDEEGEEHKITLKDGIYEVSVNPIIGINGVVGSSPKQYKSYNLTTKPKHLKERSDVAPIVINENDKSIDFNFRLHGEQEAKNLTKADLILTAEYESEELKDYFITDIKFTYNLLDRMVDEKGNPLYKCTCDGECSGDCKKFTQKIYMRNIPDVYYNNDTKTNEKIKYTASIITDDVLNEGLNYTFFAKDGSVYNLENDAISFDYNKYLGNFEPYTEGGSDYIQVNDENQVTKDIVVKWKYKTDDSWDKFIVKISDESGYIFLNDVHPCETTGSFVGITKDGDEFTKIFDGNVIPDGECTIDVSYEVEMADYYAKRTKEVETKFNYTYPVPKLTIDDIRPFTKIIYDSGSDKQYLDLGCEILSFYDEETLKNTTLNINDKIVNVSSLNYIYTFDSPTVDDTFKFKFNAANEKDTHNRLGESNECILTIGKSVDNLINLPSNGNDYIEADSLTWFTIDNDSSKQRSWKWLKENTLHDVNKELCYTLEDGTVLFGSSEADAILVDGSPRQVLYSVLNINNGETYHRRFVPYMASTRELSNPTILPSVDEILTSNLELSYDEINDSMNLFFNWESELDIPFLTSRATAEIKNMWLIINDKTGREVRRINIKGKNQLSVDMFNLDKDFTYLIEMNSEYNSTSGNTTTPVKFNSLVPLNQAIVHVGNPVVYKPNNINESVNSKEYQDNKAYYDLRRLTFNWRLNHKACDDVYFYYIVNGTTTLFRHVKLQDFFQSKILQKGDSVTYGFMMKSKYLDSNALSYVKINEKKFIVT